MSERPKRRIIPGKEKLKTKAVPPEVDPVVEELSRLVEILRQPPRIISSLHGGDINVEKQAAGGYQNTVFCEEARSDIGYSLDEALNDMRELAENIIAKKLDEAEIDYKIIYRGSASAVDIIVRPEDFEVAKILLWGKSISE